MRFNRLAPFFGPSFDIDGWRTWLACVDRPDSRRIAARIRLRRARRPTQQHGTEEYGQSLSDGGESEVEQQVLQPHHEQIVEDESETKK
jgi:hypothetical protein